MSAIRPTYSGLIAFFVSVASIFTSLVFSVIITRNLSQTEFGLWGALASLIVYGMVLDPIISYWITRETARDKISQTTAVIYNQTLSFGGIAIFVLLVFLLGVTEKFDYDILFLVILLIPIRYLTKILNSINVGWKPQNTFYGMIISEITKIIVGVILIFHFQMGLAGLIWTLVAAYLVNTIVLAILSREKITSVIQIEYAKNWTKNMFIPLYARLNTVVYESDKILIVLLTDSVIGVSYFVAAMIVGSLVTYSTTLSQVVYGKLLSGSKTDFLKDTLSLHFFVAIPLLATSVIFADIGMRILNPIYEIAAVTVIVLTIRSFFQSFRSAFMHYILGSEDIDRYSVKTRDYMKTSLFYMPTYDLIQHIVYIAILVLVFSLLMEDGMSDIDVALYWSIILLVVTIPNSVYYWKLAKKKTRLGFDWKRIVKFGIMALGVFSCTYLLIPNQISETSSFELIVKILPLILLGLGGYLGIAIIADKKIRLLVQLVFNEISTFMHKFKD